MSRSSRVPVLVLLGVLSLAAAAEAGTIPTQAEVAKVVAKHLQLVEPKITAEQKGKIWTYANAYSGQDSSCPGYSYPQGAGAVVTKNKLGAFFQAGFEAVFKGQFQAAEWCFLQALKLNYGCPALLSNAAFTLNRAGYYADSLVLLNYAVSIDPSFSSAWINIASGASQLKMFGAAKKALQIAIVLEPGLKDYQDMLKNVYAASGTKKKAGAADLDAALGVLAQGKGAPGRKSGEGPVKAVPPGKSTAQGDTSESLISGMGSSYQNDMNILGQFLPVLAVAGGQYKKESDWHAQKGKDASTQAEKDIRYVASTGLGLISTLFKGYIADISGSWEYADDMVKKAAKAIPARPADYDPAKGLAPEFKLPSLSIGFDGIAFKVDPSSDEMECEIGEGVILGFSTSSRGWSVKIGIGVQMQAGFMTGGGAAFFLKYDSTTGIKTEAKGEILSFGAKAETTFHESTLFTFEDMKGVVGASK